MFHLSSITNDFSINVDNFVSWLASVLKGLKIYDKNDKFKEIAKKIATLELKTPNVKQDLRNFLNTEFPVTKFNTRTFILENDKIPDIEATSTINQNIFKNQFSTGSLQGPRIAMSKEYTANRGTFGGKTKLEIQTNV